MKFGLKEIVNVAIDIGEGMLKSGAEISRVEDTIERILNGYNVKYKEVFALNSIIIVTARHNNQTVTESRRIKYRKINLAMLEDLNNLSRKVCDNNMSREAVLKEISSYKSKKNDYKKIIGMTLTSYSFTLFFGGNAKDAFTAGIISIVLFIIDFLLKNKRNNTLIYNFFNSFLIGIMAILFIKINLACNLDKIIIGCIMLFIPGLSTCISIDDIFNGDTMSGISGLTEGVFLAFAIAGGIGLSLVIGGVV